MASRPSFAFAALFSFLLMAAIPALCAEDRDIEIFNRKFVDATLKMDNRAVMALWAEDGVTMLPGMEPMVGRQTIARWLDDLVSKMPGYKVTAHEVEFHDIKVSGDWASEWGTTHQVVQPPDGKPPIESRGKVLLVLHRAKDGEWLIQQEMWNSSR